MSNNNPAKNSALGLASLFGTSLALCTGPLTAQEALVLEEVIVTAQKRAESVQDISATVNVVSGDAVDEFAVFSFGDVEQLTAGLTLDSPNARNSNISMRGIGTDPEAGTPPAVDVYWNDINVRPDVIFNELYDLQRFEVLRGPQGTLQGRTSPAGAINVITKKPNMSELEGYVQFSASDNDGLNGQAGISAPLIEDVLAVRVAAVYDENYAADVENITTGLDETEAEAKSARFSVSWQPTDTLTANLVYQYLDRSIDDPKAVVSTVPLEGRRTLEAEDKIALGEINNFGELEFDVASLNVEWEVLGHSLTYVAGYNDVDKLARTENDRANFIPGTDSPTFQTSNTLTDSLSHELRFASIENDVWNYMFGLYYIDQETATDFISRTTLTGNFPISFSSTGTIPVDNKEFGVFTFNKFHLNDVMTFELGLRYISFERFRSADVDFGEVINIPPAIAAFADLILPGLSATFPLEGITDRNSEDDAYTGSLTWRYDVTDETSVYASYNRGYRPGSISINPSPALEFIPENVVTYGEEESQALELGFKSRLLDGAATLNAAVYFQQFDGLFGFTRNVQVLNDAGEPQNITGGLIYNGDANVFGVEVEGEVLLSEQWSAGGSVSYNKGEWDGAETPCNEREPGEVIGFCDIDGDAVGGEPEWSLSLRSEFFVPFDSMDWYVRGLYKYTGKRENQDAFAGIGTVTDEFDAHNVFNLYTGLRSNDFVWDVSLWVKNLFDEEALTFQTGPDQFDVALSGVEGGAYTQTNVLAERIIGITARYNF